MDKFDLIIERLDLQNEDMREFKKEIKSDIKEVHEKVIQLQTNHLPHLASDIDLLKSQTKQTIGWCGTHDQKHLALEKEGVRGRWAMLCAFVGGALALLAAIANTYFK